MLDQETKRKIDSARQILVGKVPDPKAQVEQITTALIYKFMDDMDRESEELGGKARFFSNGFEKYSWGKLMDPKLGNQGRLNLYAEAIAKMSQNSHLPQLFCGIFKDAFLPYRSPETLSLFLKEINGFSYDHSEDLGNAFEYLLSVMAAQGDAGQFRTPRHIIDFIVEVVDPKKDETILDPACGTAGFLISAYKHILKENSPLEMGKGCVEKSLTPDERKNLMNNLAGYDISPDMVKLSLVNMYLHGFSEPKIFEYDTLSSEERWDESFDVIMANPPFMTPKGGIRPHKRFSVQANRSEVLFVDYILEHLNQKGRAGIIVPEGIIFQSANAYKKLRQLLIEDGLFAVVSLPAGVFNPYSGVKTSILFFDNELAKKTKDILFIKIENDGFNLGAQRREIEKNDLPRALEILKEWKNNQSISNSHSVGLLTESGDNLIQEDGGKILLEDQKYVIVKKSKIAESGDYNLTGERYREVEVYKNQKWEMVELGEVCNIQSGSRQKGGALNEGIPSIGGEQIVEDGSIRFNKMKYISENHFNSMRSGILIEGDVLLVKDGATTGKTGFYFDKNTFEKAAVNEHIFILRANEKILSNFLYNIIKSKYFQDRLKVYIKGIIGGISLEIKSIQIPLPPIEIQKEIVAELDGYQKIIDGAKQVVKNWKPNIKIDPEWKMVKLGDDKVIKIVDGDRGKNYPKKTDFTKDGFCLFLNTSNVRKGRFNFSKMDFVSKEQDELLSKGKLKKYDVVLTTRGTLGNTAFYNNEVVYKNIRINSGMVILRSNRDKLLPNFLLKILNSELFKSQVNQFLSGSAQPQLPIRVLTQIKIPIPSLKIQKQIVAEIEAEQEAIDQNKKLIEIFEEKIKKVIKRV